MPDPVEHQMPAAEREVRIRLAADSRTEVLARSDFVPVAGGLSNFAWRALDAAGEWFVRLARSGTEHLGADRANECCVVHLAAEAGLAPPVLRCDPEAGVLVTQWITGSAPVADAVEGAHLARLAGLLVRMHALRVPPDLRVVDFATQARILEQSPALPDVRLQSTAVAVFGELARAPGPCVLCHNDLNALNTVRDPSGRLWLVDWEYAGLGDAVFDLASCASQHELTDAQSGRFLQLYRAHGGTCDEHRFLLARWGFDYVQWLWYCAFRAHGDASERNLAEQRAGALASTLLERASSLPACDN